ncbi:MAG: M14 family zinc carboxypeptidase [bacterium]
MNIRSFFNQIIKSKINIPTEYARVLGLSKAAHPIYGYIYGSGNLNVSLIAGAHADEPTGPRLLYHLVNYLVKQKPQHPLLQNFTWYIIPHINPDAENKNLSWYSYQDELYDLANYLQFVVREKPGEDIEWGFPDRETAALRPENQAVYDFWQINRDGFDLHASLHSMGKSFGPWFLIDEDWVDRSTHIQKVCKEETHKMGYQLFDVDRKGEKGFTRINAGFATKPNSQAMKLFFLQRDEPGMADKFHASSMESIKTLGGNPLTIVSEMPLFILPKKNDDISWPNPELSQWNDKLKDWSDQLKQKQANPEQVNYWAQKEGVKSMRIVDQMYLQWIFICASIEQITQVTGK